MLLKSSYQRELDNFCKSLMGGDYSIRQVTKGALSQARKKLNPWAFQRLSEVIVNTFYEEAEIYAWNKFRILAIDGSRIRLPKSEEIALHFGVPGFGPGSQSQTSLATCSLLYDVLNSVTIDAQLGPYNESERKLFDRQLDKINKGDLILADRGYAGYDLFLKLMARGADFCFRLPENLWNEAKDLKNSKDKERIIEVKLNEKISDANNGIKSLQLRLIKIKLKNGETEILATSLLDMKKYKHEEFKGLYHLRWSIEENYKLFKSRIEIEAFSGKTVRSVEQDFFAKILMMNLCAVMSHPIAEKVEEEYKADITGNKYDQKINMTQALGVTRENLINLLIKKIRGRTIRAMDIIIAHTRELIRPLRYFPRNKKDNKKSKIFSTGYKGI